MQVYSLEEQVTTKEDVRASSQQWTPVLEPDVDPSYET